MYFPFCRESRFVFQWSGVKRVEAVSGGPWENAPKSCLVFIGTDKSELESIHVQLSKLAEPHKEIASCIGSEGHARNLSMKVAADGRFKVWNIALSSPLLLRQILYLYAMLLPQMIFFSSPRNETSLTLFLSSRTHHPCRLCR